MSNTHPSIIYCRELDHDIIQILNLGGIQQGDETSSVLAEDFDDEEDDEYRPNDNEEDEAVSAEGTVNSERFL